MSYFGPSNSAYVSPAAIEVARGQLSYFLEHYGVDRGVKEAIIWDFDLCTFEWARRHLSQLPPKAIYHVLCEVLREELKDHPFQARLWGAAVCSTKVTKRYKTLG